MNADEIRRNDLERDRLLALNKPAAPGVKVGAVEPCEKHPGTGGKCLKCYRVLEDKLSEARKIIKRLIDDEPCNLDVRDRCLVHLSDKPCNVGEARKFLK